MKNTPSTHTPKQKISLSPEDTSVGAMDRAFLAETRSPDDPFYDAQTDLEAMRDMRQVIENRLNNPAQYNARGATNETQILTAPGQFPEFKNYPNELPADRIKDNVNIANDSDDPRQPAYKQHVQDAITAATENVDPPVAGLPGATAWVKTPPKGKATSPGPNFGPLRDVGGNTFFNTMTLSPAAVEPGPEPDHLEGKSAVEKLRHYAAQARADAAKKPVSPAMRFHQNVMKLMQHQRSYAPVPHRGAGPARPAARGDEGASAGPEQYGSFLQYWLVEMRRRRAAGVSANGANIPGGAGAAQQAARGATPSWRDSMPAITKARRAMLGDPREWARRNPWHAAALARAARSPAGLAAGGMSRALPSIAPRMAPGVDRAALRDGYMPYEDRVTREAGGVQAPPFAARASGGVADAAAAPGVEFGGAAGVRGRALQKAVQAYFEIQARLPPSGATGFDPRVTPAWPGLQISG